MHFRSLRSFVVALAGPCLLAVVAALVVYNLLAAARTQQTVDEHTHELMENALSARLDAIANAEGARIQRELNKTMTLAEQLATTNALMGAEDAEGQRALFLSRRQLSNLVRQTLAENPSLLDAYIGWEPDAFGDDARFAGDERYGHNESGRFMPWWYRDDDGSLALLPLGDDIESETRLANGVRQGEYYLCPRETLSSCIVDPAAYDFGGTTHLVTSFNAPILVDGEFRGIAGADLSLSFIQALLTDANQALYDGAGRMALIAEQGVLVADTAGEDDLGMPATDSLESTLLAGIEEAVAQNRLHSSTADGMLKRFQPITLGDDAATWVLVLQLPESVALAELNDLQSILSEQKQQNTLGMTLIGLLLATIGMAALWWIGGRIARPLKRLANRMEEIASGHGDLTQRLPVHGRDESAAVAQQFNAFAEKIQAILLDVRQSSESVNTAATEIATGGQDLSRRTENAASSLQQTSASMEEITSTVEHTAASAREANQLSLSASQVAERGGQAVSEVVTTMEDIAASSNQIGDIVSLMDGIAFQTNLLALNASVEAARAGEHGRGFAVVADEVRKLASRSTDASNEIKQLIETSQSKVENGTTLVRHAGETMQDIVRHIAQVSDVLGEITAATGEQSDGIGQVNVAVAELDRMTQENAAMVEESTTAAEQLKEQAIHLTNIISNFKLSQQQGQEEMQALSGTRTPALGRDNGQRHLS